MFLLCVNYLLPQLDRSHSRKWRDKCRAKRNTVSTLRWLTVAADWCESFKEIHGQVKNWRRNCFYFAMMICCCWWISVLQGHLGTGQEPKEKLFLLCDDEMLPLIDVRPSNKLMDRSRTEGDTVSTLRWWSVAADRCASFKQIDGQVANWERKFFLWILNILIDW